MAVETYKKIEYQITHYIYVMTITGFVSIVSYLYQLKNNLKITEKLYKYFLIYVYVQREHQSNML